MRYCCGCSTTHMYCTIWKDTPTNGGDYYTHPPPVYMCNCSCCIFVRYILYLSVYTKCTTYSIIHCTRIQCARLRTTQVRACLLVPHVYSLRVRATHAKCFFKFFTCITIEVSGKVPTATSSVLPPMYVCYDTIFFYLSGVRIPHTLCKKKTQIIKAYRSLGVRGISTFPP